MSDHLSTNQRKDREKTFKGRGQIWKDEKRAKVVLLIGPENLYGGRVAPESVRQGGEDRASGGKVKAEKCPRGGGS